MCKGVILAYMLRISMINMHSFFQVLRIFRCPFRREDYYVLLTQSYMYLFQIPFHHIVIAVAVFPFFRDGIREQIAVNGKIHLI